MSCASSTGPIYHEVCYTTSTRRLISLVFGVEENVIVAMVPLLVSMSSKLASYRGRRGSMRCLATSQCFLDDDEG
uniref:Uncharacterized protein n=1 Tax=Arundo donax TaxID=35708 RepID=A0A0A9ACV7_ARUDO